MCQTFFTEDSMEDYFKEHYTPTSSSFNLNEERYLIQSRKSNPCSNLNYRLLHPGIPKIPGSSSLKNPTKGINSPVNEENFPCDDCDDCDECNESLEPYCHVKLDSIIKLKNSTKKLLYLLDEIQSKTHTKIEFLTLENFIKRKPLITNIEILYDDAHASNFLNVFQSSTEVSDNISIPALRNLENHAINLEGIYLKEEDNDCSVYKRLTRKCHCLNEVEYNDFVIHFNEETKYSTSNIGEIIKNVRILKKFLYMGGIYTKHALMFVNEGLTDSQPTEKIEITQGCTHADICNIFDDHSLVITCISWPCKHYYFGDTVTQALAAGLLYKLAEIEEGRRYLNFSSRITNDIRKVLRKKSSFLEVDTLDSLNATLDLLKPPFSKNFNATYLNKSIYEGFGYKTVNDLLKFRQYMTLDEILTHLDLLKNFSNNDSGKTELTKHLPSILVLFKNMLMEFNNSEMNIIITHILNNIVSKNMVQTSEQEQSKVVSIADTATEPIKMRNEMIQMPPKHKNSSKKPNKTKLSLGVAPTKNRQSSVRQVSGWESSSVLNRSRKFTKDLRRSIIVVPIENNEEDTEY